MEWFSRHPLWLYSETQQLSNNSIYKEKFQFIDKTLISAGNILIHKLKTEYHPLLIVYPEATPYIPPIIYILKNELDEEKAKEYSTLSPKEIRKRIQENKRFFHRRHQNEDGSICFVETGDLHSDKAEKYLIKDIIKRIRIWLAGEIPEDSREVELFHHFKKRTYEMQYLLPDLFFNTKLIKGQFFAGLSNLIPANFLPDGLLKKTYVGIMIFGENKGGVTLPPRYYTKEKMILFTRIPEIKELILIEDSEKKRKAIKEDKLIEGYWWDIQEEPEPFSTVNSLSKYIGNGEEKEGIEKLTESLKVPLKKLHKFIHFGIRFPGRWREKDWQMFRLIRGHRPPLIGNNSKKELKERLLDYSVEAVYQSYFTEKDFHIRNKGRAERDILKNKGISIIGCGALGSETSDALNKAGIGRILLVDKGEFNLHNAIRHCLGVQEISYPKVFGMFKYLFLHNPFVNTDYKILDILKNPIDEYLPSNTIGISTIADDNIEAYLNEQAVKKERTVFYCRGLRGGKAARIFRVIPYKDACKTCLSLYRNESSSFFIDIEEDKNLPIISTECNNPIRPASAADVKLIASIFSRIIIDFLQGVSLKSNHWIWSSEPIEQIKLDKSIDGFIHGKTIPPHPVCPVCQKLEYKKVYIENQAYKYVKRESADSKKIETGGVLIGHITKKGEYIILRATKPGPKAVRTENRFERDEEFCQKELEKAAKELGVKGLYLGEWHYHPLGSNVPSGLDIKSLTEIAIQENYRIDKPIMIIIAPSLEFAITIHDQTRQCVQLPIEICEDISSID